MRKLLLGTTAMVAAGFVAGPAQAADPISLQLGGYYRVAYYGIFDQSDAGACDGLGGGCTVQSSGARGATQTGVIGAGANAITTTSEAGFNRNSTAFSTDGEIHFTGSTTLDNGIGVAVQIELEVMDGSSNPANTQDVMDEHYITLSGGFGSVRLGVEDTIGNSYSTTAPVGASLFGVNSPGFIASNSPRTNSTVLTVGGDAASIRYETPTFAGFRMGFSYTPDATDSENNQEADQGQDGTTTKSDLLGALYGVAAAYSGTFGDIGVNWSASAAYGENDDDTSQHGNCGGSVNGLYGSCEDQWEWQTGLNVSFFGFTVGGSFRHGANVGAVGGDTADVWDAGVSYNTGPVTVGLSMSRGTYNRRGLTDAAVQAGAVTAFNDGNVFVGGANAGTLTVVQLGATYALGPGVSLQGAVTWDEFDSRQSVNANRTAAADPVDARAIRHQDYRSWSGGLALGLSF